MTSEEIVAIAHENIAADYGVEALEPGELFVFELENGAMIMSCDNDRIMHYTFTPEKIRTDLWKISCDELEEDDV